MLRDIRKASANWLGKLVMGTVVGVLAISFAIWGVGDIFRGFGRSTVATVGSNEITAEQFRQIYNERLQQISAQIGRPIPADQVRALGLDRQILGQLVADMALDERARKLGLGITDEEVARQIRELPAFRGASGKFDHDVFMQRVRAAGYTEPRFVNERRRLMVRQQVTDSVGAVASAPKTVLEVANRFQNERRAIEYVTLTRAQAGEITPPTPEQLTNYFDARKVTFRAPEYRKITIVTLSPEEVSKWITVSDEEAKRVYDERRARFVTPGRRQIEQIIFPSDEEAEAVKKRIDAGATFADIAKARGMSEKDIDLGLVTRTALAPDVAEAAFSLPEGAVSKPVKARLGTALIRVVKIEPDQVKPYEQAADEIKQELGRDRARTELAEKHDRLEDERAAGSTLAEAAQKAGLTATTIDAVDRTGRDPSGALVPLPTDGNILLQAFTTDVGVETDAIRTPDNGYVWFEVAGITPQRDRTLDEVKDTVTQRWTDEQVAERLQTKAAAIVEQVKAGKSLADVATAEGLKLEQASDLRRNAAAPGLSPAAVSAVFETAKDGVAAAQGASPAERVVFRVTGVTVPPIETAGPDGTRRDETMRTSIGEDLLRQYIAQIENEVGTKINLDALRRIVGGEQL
ncbi:MAG: SurA N-terminal domain-containing protein [Rhizobiales bacterium]|nr:SurA N-terminal domain-containing protein [Hyphomicrobiales bacterium]